MRSIHTGLLILRLGIGILLITHGWPKIIGGTEMWEKVGHSMSMLGINFAPTFWGLMAALSEGLGGLLIAIGLFTRVAGSFVLFTMIIAALHHFNAGDGLGGASHALSLAVVGLALLFTGAGEYSIDRVVRKK
ncbi:MAG TPA: DoxX family protein [Bacteroidia bacterium]|jgi:putative oxidoreductase